MSTTYMLQIKRSLLFRYLENVAHATVWFHGNRQDNGGERGGGIMPRPHSRYG